MEFKANQVSSQGDNLLWWHQILAFVMENTEVKELWNLPLWLRRVTEACGNGVPAWVPRTLHEVVQVNYKLHWPQDAEDARAMRDLLERAAQMTWNQTLREKNVTVSKAEGQSHPSPLTAGVELKGMDLSCGILVLHWSSISSLFPLSSLLEW